MTFARFASNFRTANDASLVQAPVPRQINPNATALLANLPKELFEEICNHVRVQYTHPQLSLMSPGLKLEDTAVRTMRLLCKAVADALSRVVFRTLALSIDRMGHQRILDKLQILVEGRCTEATRGTRVLAIGSLSLDADDFQARDVDEKMMSLLPAAISTLSGVHTVEWVPRPGDSRELQSAIADAVITLPNLKHVRFTSAHCLVESFVPRLPPLISFGFGGDGWGGYTNASEERHMHQAAKCIANSPGLICLQVVRDLIANPSAVTSLHFLFKDINATKAPPLKLTTLFLNGLYVRLDVTIIPHLKNLKSLEIWNVRHPERELEDSLPGTNVPSLEYAASFSEFWKALKSSGITLSYLVIASTFISDTFAEYITSYSGLKDLTIKGLHPDASRANESQAGAFWDGLASHHGVSLLRLTVYPWYEGSWCFSQERATSLGGCRNLKTLNVAIATAQLESQNGESRYPLPPQWDVGQSVNALFDTVNAKMPNLEQLIISATDPEHIRYSLLMGARPSVRVAHFSTARKRLSESVAEYATPASCGRLPNLQIDVNGDILHWKSSIRSYPRLGPPSAATISKRRLPYRHLLSLLSHKFNRTKSIPSSYQRVLMYRQITTDDSDEESDE